LSCTNPEKKSLSFPDFFIYFFRADFKTIENTGSCYALVRVRLSLERQQQTFEIGSSMYLLNPPYDTVQDRRMIRLTDVADSVLALTGKSVGKDGRGFSQMTEKSRLKTDLFAEGQKLLVIRTRIFENVDRLTAEVTSAQLSVHSCAFGRPV